MESLQYTIDFLLRRRPKGRHEGTGQLSKREENGEECALNGGTDKDPSAQRIESKTETETFAAALFSIPEKKDVMRKNVGLKERWEQWNFQLVFTNGHDFSLVNLLRDEKQLQVHNLLHR
ncbi:hypothetical protein HPP92_019807 [Vanilla planifolia]|uniref:Uncharacterized protein n=1 Tax=Vanilla planifolia TaxID=51239 RepID=A0A835Q6G2_VANPL|nr:hypothetical protein HPP92_019807 [Vanilla planifolia]